MSFKQKENRILTTLKKGEVPLGMQFNTGDPSLVEILGYTGFDFYMLCLEHGHMGIERIEHCVRAADAAGITTIVRVPENDPSIIRHCIEAGAQGIVIPHIKTREDAKKAVASVRYPPEGECGICPAIRAAQYSIADWNEYLEQAKRQNMVILLLEDKEAVENAEEIFAELKPGLDAAGLARGDLSQSITLPGEKVTWNHPYMEKAFEKVMAISKRTGIPLMDMPRPEHTPECAKKVLDSGVKIILYSVDQLLFYQMCQDIVEGIKGKTVKGSESVQ